jgi:hypothetical protein
MLLLLLVLVLVLVSCLLLLLVVMLFLVAVVQSSNDRVVQASPGLQAVLVTSYGESQASFRVEVLGLLPTTAAAAMWGMPRIAGLHLLLLLAGCMRVVETSWSHRGSW